MVDAHYRPAGARYRFRSQGPSGARYRPSSRFPVTGSPSRDRHCPGAVRPIPVRRTGSNTTTGTAMSANGATAAGGGAGRGRGAKRPRRSAGGGAGGRALGLGVGGGTWVPRGGTWGLRTRGAPTGVGRPRDVPERQGVRMHLRGWRRDRDPPGACWGDVGLRCPNAVLGKEACACPTGTSPRG